jgi:hypothetical protein
MVFHIAPLPNDLTDIAMQMSMQTTANEIVALSIRSALPTFVKIFNN